MHWEHRVLSIFPTFEMGGAQRRYVLLANTFAPMKLPRFEHIIVSLDGNITATRRFNEDVKWRTVKDPGKKGSFFSNIFAYRALLNELKPDLVITHNWGSIEWAMANTFTDFRHIHIEDGFSNQEVEHQLLRRVWFRKLALAGKEIIVPGRGLEKIARTIWKAPRSSIEMIPNGINILKFRKSCDTPVELPEGAFIVGAIAALRPEKDLCTLIEAFFLFQKDHQNSFLLIGGSGTEMPKLQAKAKELSIAHRVHFLGNIAEPANLVPCFDILALSSITEQVPMCVIEAMAASKPIISTDVGDIKHMVCSENSKLIEGVKTTEQLAAGLLALAKDDERRKRIGEENYESSRADYDLEDMKNRWLDVFLRDVDAYEITIPEKKSRLYVVEEE